jgi:hypothetical protein
MSRTADEKRNDEQAHEATHEPSTLRARIRFNGFRQSSSQGKSIPGLGSVRIAVVIDAFAKQYLHSDLRDVRGVMVWKLDGLSDYDVRRPLTSTGTNLLGLVKHLSMAEARYFGDVFGRPFPERLPWWDDNAEYDADKWATEDETRDEIVERYARVCAHSDMTIDSLDIDAPGHVPWWPRPNVMLFNVLVHVLTETSRHAGHADILREQLDGSVGTDAGAPALHGKPAAFLQAHVERVEQAARAATGLTAS